MTRVDVRSRRMPAVKLLSLGLLLTSVACSPCREICREYDAVLDRENQRAPLTPGIGLADQLAIAVSEDVLALTADRLTDALATELRRGLPTNVRLPLVEIPIRTDVSVDLASLRLIELRDAVGVDVSMTFGISVSLEGVGGASAGVNGGVTVRASLALEGDGEASALVLRLRESSLRDLTLTPTGMAALGRVGRVVLDAVQDAVRFLLQPSTLSEMGDLTLLTIRPVVIEGLQVRLSPNSLRFNAARSRLRVGLRTDLPVPDEPNRLPRPGDASSDVEVLATAALGRPLLAALLAQDDGRRFDAGGRVDRDGPYRVTVSELTTRRGAVDFSYRIYRTAVPCLVADMAGSATIDWVDGGPVAELERHELVYASRFESAVEAAQPPVDGLSRRLTQLLASALTFDAIQLPGGLSVELVPDGLEIAPAGYRVGWRVSSVASTSRR